MLTTFIITSQQLSQSCAETCCRLHKQADIFVMQPQPSLRGALPGRAWQAPPGRKQTVFDSFPRHSGLDNIQGSLRGPSGSQLAHSNPVFKRPECVSKSFNPVTSFHSMTSVRWRKYPSEESSCKTGSKVMCQVLAAMLPRIS